MTSILGKETSSFPAFPATINGRLTPSQPMISRVARRGENAEVPPSELQTQFTFNTQNQEGRNDVLIACAPTGGISRIGKHSFQDVEHHDLRTFATGRDHVGISLRASSSTGASPTLTFVRPTGMENRDEREQQKPLLVYLPGAEQGEGLAAKSQFADLSRIFDVRSLRISTSDRSSFAEMVSVVTDFVREHRTHPAEGVPGGKAVLLGEGFGGLLALGVALGCQDELQGLVLVNPATSFERSSLGSLLANSQVEKV